VWLWIESGATHVGTYAALRNEAEMRLGGAASLVFREQKEVFARRCARCHGRGGVPAVPYNAPEWPDTRGLKRPLARHERRVIDSDPLARFGVNAIVNMTRPELSPLLLGPLSKSTGGWGSCGEAFADKDDADYQRLLQSLKKGKQLRDSIPRYTVPGWNPNPQYVREMKRFGILPAGLDPARDKVDPFATDRAYWRSLWGEAGAL